MSAVLMCDNCGELFSVNAKGWSAVTVTKSVFNEHNHGAETRHMGPCCAIQEGGPIKPRLALENRQKTDEEFAREQNERLYGKNDINARYGKGALDEDIDG